MFGVVLASAAMVYGILALPSIASAAAYLVGDVGAFLKADILLGEGLRPGVDFPLNYGLLGLVAQHVALSWFGRSPWVSVSMTGVLFLGVGGLLGVLAGVLGLRRASLGALAMLSPHLLWSVGIVPWVHGLEAVLILSSLVALVRQRYGVAAFAAFAAALVKPGMGFALCALVVVLALLSGRTPRVLGRAAAGFGATALLLLGALGALFGSRSLVATIVAADARRHYAAMGYGLQQLVHGFLALPHANAGYFLGHPVILLVVLISVLTAAGCSHVFDIAHRACAPMPFLLAAAALTSVWILFLFGNAFSWGYYLYLPVFGCLLVVESWPSIVRRVALGTIVVLTLLSYRTVVWPSVVAWAAFAPAPAFAGLWSDPVLAAEWKTIGGIIGPSRAVAVTRGGDPSHFGRIWPAPYWILAPGLDDARVTRVMQRAVATSCFVLRDVASGWVPPTLDREMQSLQVVFSGRYFRLYRNPRCARLPAAPGETPGT